MKRTAYILFILFFACSCTYDIEEVLLQREDISLTLNGKEEFSFNARTCQLGYNDKKHEYRVHDDAIGNWFILDCDSKPATEGQSITADVSWTDETTTRRRHGLKFTVEKTSADGYIWMWCKTDNIGVVIKDI